MVSSCREEGKKFLYTLELCTLHYAVVSSKFRMNPRMPDTRSERNAGAASDPDPDCGTVGEHI
jgi:hypothetical protein